MDRSPGDGAGVAVVRATDGSRSALGRWSDSLSLLTLSLLVGDLSAMLLVLVTGLHGRSDPEVVGAACFALLVCRAAAQIYRPRLRLAYLDDLPRAVAAAGAGFLITAGLLVLLDGGAESVATTAWTVVSLALVTEVPRGLALLAAGLVRRSGYRGARTVVMADGELGDDLVSTMLAHPEYGLRPAVRLEVAGSTADLTSAVRHTAAQTVVIASPQPGQEIVETVIVAHRLGCSVLVLPALYELFDDRPNVERLRSFPLIRMSGDPTRRLSWRIKRLGDVLVASTALLLLAPLLVLVGVGVLITLGRPVLFVQERVGRSGHPFRILKFRTLPMTDEQDSGTTWSVDGDARVAGFPRFLRSTSLDELPQLVNILRGDMSLVGPRPERPAFVDRFSAMHDGYGARHRVPAGLTGLAQISGLRGDTSISDRARFDNYYIANWSLWLDLRIVLLTAGELARHAWASEGGSRPPLPSPRTPR